MTTYTIEQREELEAELIENILFHRRHAGRCWKRGLGAQALEAQAAALQNIEDLRELRG